jgi:hypothetical protein
VNFTHYRGVRGDGNCYYRSVSYGYIEMLTLSRNVLALQDIIRWVNSNGTIYSIPRSEFNYSQAISQGLKEIINCIEKRFTD